MRRENYSREGCYNITMKQFTVVFPITEWEGKRYILLGQQRPGKPLAGYLNGYGGKVEEGESILECAGR